MSRKFFSSDSESFDTGAGASATVDSPEARKAPAGDDSKAREPFQRGHWDKEPPTISRTSQKDERFKDPLKFVVSKRPDFLKRARAAIAECDAHRQELAPLVMGSLAREMHREKVTSRLSNTSSAADLRKTYTDLSVVAIEPRARYDMTVAARSSIGKFLFEKIDPFFAELRSNWEDDLPSLREEATRIEGDLAVALSNAGQVMVGRPAHDALDAAENKLDYFESFWKRAINTFHPGHEEPPTSAPLERLLD